jgi:hypothetical protein
MISFFHFHHELYFPVDAVQEIYEGLQFLDSMSPDDKGIIDTAIPTGGLVCGFVQSSLSSKSSMKKLAITGERVEPIAKPSVSS